MHSKKPISEKQLAANRANAKKSTGPRTAAGRQTASQNALKHGLTGNFGVLPGEDHAAHQAFCREIIHEFAPASALELNLAQTIANDFWRISRIAAIETNVFAVGAIEEGIIEDRVSPTSEDPDPDHDSDLQLALAGARTFFNHIGKFGLLSLYEQRLNRTIHKNQAKLRQMQQERQNARQMALLARQLIDSQPTTDPNGFVRVNNIFERSNLAHIPAKAA
jgi:hypothetical protein